MCISLFETNSCHSTTMDNKTKRLIAVCLTAAVVTAAAGVFFVRRRQSSETPEAGKGPGPDASPSKDKQGKKGGDNDKTDKKSSEERKKKQQNDADKKGKLEKAITAP
ncbi:MAG: hypothetical protein MHMPM18_000322 [Marteilia pararefringens]